jgi:hypothetical protein
MRPVSLWIVLLEVDAVKLRSEQTQSHRWIDVSGPIAALIGVVMQLLLDQAQIIVHNPGCDSDRARARTDHVHASLEHTRASRGKHLRENSP